MAITGSSDASRPPASPWTPRPPDAWTPSSRTPAYGDPHRPTDDRVELATSPETVALTGLFASPHWHELNDLHAEAARRLAVGVQDLPADLPRHGLVTSDN
ncbi:hypothetical protein [Streptomyces sp. NPDC004435]|uniref:hypothetical protein n=1 Tax=Streptomyces sp. NPDC004435 TaxID=3364701 RepID=UPI003691ABA8